MFWGNANNNNNSSQGNDGDYILEPASGLTEKQKSLIEVEDEYRRLFAENPNSFKLADPHALLKDVFETKNDFTYKEEDPDEALVPKILTSNRTKGNPGESAIKTETEFHERWKTFTNGLLEGLDWNNVFIAGGAVQACLLTRNIEEYQSSDIDMFFYGMNSDAEANNKLRHIYDVIQNNVQKNAKKDVQQVGFSRFKKGSEGVVVVRSFRAVTILGEYPNRHVQIILRHYRSPAEVLLGFDIDSCTVGFDGNRVWAMERFQRAITKGYNLVNETRRSLTYETRLLKYSKRGFAVAVPDLDKARVDRELFNRWDLKNIQGMSKLLLYEYYDIQSRFYPSFTRSLPRKFPRPNDENKLLFREGKEESDYSIVFPWGPNWWSSTILALLDFKDKAQYFSRQNGGRRLSKPGLAKITPEHKHLYVSGLESVINGASPALSAGWCKLCQAKKPLEADESGRCIDSEPLKWAKDNPSYQDLDRGFRRSLMTGSFHPVIEENFWKDVYPQAPNPPTQEKHPLARLANNATSTGTPSKNASFTPGALQALPSLRVVCDYCSKSFHSENQKLKHQREECTAYKPPANALFVQQPQPQPQPQFSFGGSVFKPTSPASPTPQLSFGGGTPALQTPTPPSLFSSFKLPAVSLPAPAPAPKASSLPVGVTPTFVTPTVNNTPPPSLPDLNQISLLQPQSNNNNNVPTSAGPLNLKDIMATFQRQLEALSIQERGNNNNNNSALTPYPPQPPSPRSIFGQSPSDFSNFQPPSIIGSRIEDFGGNTVPFNIGRSRITDINTLSHRIIPDSTPVYYNENRVAPVSVAPPSWWDNSSSVGVGARPEVARDAVVLTDKVSKALLLVGMLARKGQISPNDKARLKELALKEDVGIMSVLNAFEIELDIQEAADSMRVLLGTKK
eukprot:TRINITY_DN5726_c0_g1_i2.p1 TRINITY_DN5726_c0_g1~~TRINITY_DN5726_c0_g1_i2.p1  ORF type:complete len:905 (-),score=210.35 TRINITY_DN5726_c0_g1_i2:202-2916(-)